MAIKKKVVFFPYDFDTAIGTNNEGALQFSYNLEDIDVIGNNEDVYNGQQSVLWKNLRAAFPEELKAMYQTLRSQGAISYEKIEQMFELHQSKWPEAVINEDSYFTYLEPLVNPSVNADGKPDSGYLSMLQGTKEQQRKWWLYNRFRYIDSKYNAGDALTDVITLRAYAKSNITVTPYADIYASVKYGSYLVQQRANRNTAYTLTCPVDNMNDTEVYIYSASQLASIGDLSGLNVGYANFSNATRLQLLKVGDSSSNYSNTVMLDLFLGNNVLLETLDARNCVNLGGSRSVGGNIVNSTTPTIDLSGCVDIKNIYFDNTSIKGVNIPNGAPLQVLHLPATITNLTLRNLHELEDLTCPSFANVTTLRIENCSDEVDPLAILDQIPANSRVRIIGFDIDASTYQDIVEFYDELDTMRGLDENGNTVEIEDGGAQVSGTIRINSLTGAELAALQARYPYITVIAAHTTSYRYFKSYDGSTNIGTVACFDGMPQSSAPTVPSRADSSDGHYSYTPIGWSTNTDSQTNNYTHNSETRADVIYYAAYTWNTKTYTVTWKNSNGNILLTDNNVPWGTKPVYNGSTPTYNGQNATGWDRNLNEPITGNTIITATYVPTYTVNFYNDSGIYSDSPQLLYSVRVPLGDDAVYGGETPTSEIGPFLNWDQSLTNIRENRTVYANFDISISEPDLKYLIYSKDDSNRIITVTGLNNENIQADNITKITIPDTINSYKVIIL